MSRIFFGRNFMVLFMLLFFSSSEANNTRPSNETILKFVSTFCDKVDTLISSPTSAVNSKIDLSDFVTKDKFTVSSPYCKETKVSAIDLKKCIGTGTGAKVACWCDSFVSSCLEAQLSNPNKRAPPSIKWINDKNVVVEWPEPAWGFKFHLKNSKDGKTTIEHIVGIDNGSGD